MSPVPLHKGEQAAAETRERLRISPLQPIADLVRVVEDQCDVPVYIRRFDEPKVAGVLLRSARNACLIGINADHHAVKQRFTLAHELGHIEMDHPAHVDKVDELFGRGASTAEPIEVEANYFAAEFLAPRQAVLAWLETHAVDAVIDADVVARIALTFGVAMNTVCFRLEAAGAITSQTKWALVTALKSKSSDLARKHQGERRPDALDDWMGRRAYPRLPDQLVSLAKRALDAELLDQEEFDEMVPSQPGGSRSAPWN